MICCTPYTPDQACAFLTLYHACLAHYGIDPATSEQDARVLSILGSGRHMSCLMAHDGDEPLGFATWALTLPAGAGVALYMKELFVDQSARGKGVGRTLLAGLLDIAQDEGCTRMDWQTDRDNPLSQAFYDSIDAPAFEKRSYRITRGDFTAFRSSLRAV